jgi:hypothetical protein
MSWPWPASSRVDRAIVAAYRDQRWTLRQCSYVFGPSVKTIARILARAGVPRRPPRDRRAGLPGPAELASTLRYAQRGYEDWDTYGLRGGCDDSYTAVVVFDRLIGRPIRCRSVWASYHPALVDAAAFSISAQACGLISPGITWIRVRQSSGELYIVGPSAAGWWYARPRGDGLGPGWCAPTLAGLAARIGSRAATRIVPSRRC